MSDRLTEDGVTAAADAAESLLDAPRLSDEYDLVEEETDVVEDLEEKGWGFVGVGMTRVVFHPSEDAVVDPYSASSYVVKLPRSVEPNAPASRTGVGQNRAERRVYDRLREEAIRTVDTDWFAEVYDCGSTTLDGSVNEVTVEDAWLVMEWLPTLRDVYPDAKPAVLENIADEFRAAFRGSPLRIDAGIDNIGVRVWDRSDAPSLDEKWEAAEWCAFVDYGIPNWDGWNPAKL